MEEPGVYNLVGQIVTGSRREKKIQKTLNFNLVLPASWQACRRDVVDQNVVSLLANPLRPYIAIISSK